MNEHKPRIDPFVLVIDEDRSDVLSILLAAVEDRQRFLKTLKAKGKIEVFKQLFNEMSDKEHERHWCKATDCTYDYDKLEK